MITNPNQFDVWRRFAAGIRRLRHATGPGAQSLKKCGHCLGKSLVNAARSIPSIRGNLPWGGFEATTESGAALGLSRRSSSSRSSQREIFSTGSASSATASLPSGRPAARLSAFPGVEGPTSVTKRFCRMEPGARTALAREAHRRPGAMGLSLQVPPQERRRARLPSLAAKSVTKRFCPMEPGAHTAFHSESPPTAGRYGLIFTGTASRAATCKAAFPGVGAKIRDEVFLPDGTWGAHRFSLGKPTDGRALWAYPYRYRLKSGDVQDRTATVYVYRQAWRYNWLRWDPLFEVERAVHLGFLRRGNWRGRGILERRLRRVLLRDVAPRDTGSCT